MKVYVIPADAHACGHNRLIWPANVLQKQGHNIEIVPPKKGSGFLAKTMEGPNGQEILTSIQMPEDMDVVVIQRPAHPLQPQMIDCLRQNKVAVVVDMDDDMSTIHPNNSAFQMYRPRSGSPFSWKWAAESCKRATLVTCSTRALLKTYAKHGRGMVIDNYVPKAYLNFDKPDTGCFGWAGTTKSHPDDLQVTGKATQQLVDEGHQLRIVGGDRKVQAALKLTEPPQMTGSMTLDKWALTIADTMDVGMAPLSPSTFNAAKSRLKGIEMFALGIPWVASPREEYRRLTREAGAGLLADHPKQWYSQLKALLTDEVLRKEQAEAGRTYMQDQTYEVNAWRQMEAWTRAYEMERG